MSENYRKKLEEFLDVSTSIFLGKEKVIEMATISILADGHLLIEDVPGVGKTTLVYLISKLLGLDVSRIQFTNDLLPSDILGTMIFDRESQKFNFQKGANFWKRYLSR